ncbi:hypothetical protein GBS0709_17450 [Edwardsiella tarda]|nr:hypothetical protein GBS0709_17450 [Edwardsiella tarda]
MELLTNVADLLTLFRRQLDTGQHPHAASMTIAFLLHNPILMIHILVMHHPHPVAITSAVCYRRGGRICGIRCADAQSQSRSKNHSGQFTH